MATHQHHHGSNLDSHLNFRMSSQDKLSIEFAAKLKGLKPNTYARQRLLEAAEKDIKESNSDSSLILSSEQWNFFMEIMEAPAKINPKLKRAFKDFENSMGQK